MLTELSIGNFKAFGETQRVPIKPLTLIFGANSAGKSSLLHGLLAGSHALKTGDLNVMQTGIGGDMVDLGGFAQFVHRGKTDRQAEWGFNLEIASTTKQLREMFASFKTVSVALNFGTGQNSSGERVLAVQRLRIATDELQLIDCEYAHTSNIADIHWWGPLTEQSREDYSLRTGQPSATTTFWMHGVNHEHPAVNRWLEHFWKKIAGVGPAKTDWRIIKEGWETICDWRFFVESLLPKQISDDRLLSGQEMQRRGFPNGQRKKAVVSFAQQMMGSFFDLLFDQIHRSLTDQLGRLMYLGPLRALPPRRLFFPLTPARIGDGSQAWQIVAQDKAVRERLNHWLTDPSKLNTSLELISREWKAERGQRMAEVLIRDKRTNTLVSHRDVGVGVSQVLPLMVAALSTNGHIHLVEQPELHLHPALQAELGDLFIESALGERKNTFLLETHSEHLILRILRRVRETSEGILAKGKIPLRPKDVSVIYVQPTQNGSKIASLPVTPDGDFSVPWPGGFFAERFQELP